MTASPSEEILVSLAVTPDLAERARCLAETLGIGQTDATLAIVAAGVEALSHARRGGGPYRADLDLHSELAALRFRAFHLERDKRALEMNLTGHKAEGQALRTALARVRQENALFRLLLGPCLATGRAQIEASAEQDAVLVAALEYPFEPARQAAATILARRGGPALERAVPILVAALGDAETARVEGAAAALAQVGDVAIDPLLAVIRAKTGEALAAGRRLRAIALLGQLRAARAAPKIGELSADPDPRVRAAAVTALAGIGGVTALGLIVRFAGDQSAMVREAVVRAFVTVDDLEPVACGLADTERGVRATARRELQRLGDAARPTLEAVVCRRLPLGGTWVWRWRARAWARRLLRDLERGDRPRCAGAGR